MMGKLPDIEYDTIFDGCQKTFSASCELYKNAVSELFEEHYYEIADDSIDNKASAQDIFGEDIIKLAKLMTTAGQVMG